MSAVLQINLNAIRENAASVRDICECRGVQVLGVTKGVAADLNVVRAMLEGGIAELADARLDNIEEMRRGGIVQPVTLLRIPSLSEAEQTVALADASLNSELVTLQALSAAAVRAGRVHNAVLMIELGDLREGVLPHEALGMMRIAKALPGLRITGIGTNMGCYGGILPTQQNLSILAHLKHYIESELEMNLSVVSGGGTSSLQLVREGALPPEINQLRIGEAILLGTDTTRHCVLPFLRQDTFLLRAEVIELKTKPSLPVGTSGCDAFGNVPEFVNRGMRDRAIVSLGRQDVRPEDLVPLDRGIHIVGASSDHMILDVTECATEIRLGSWLEFELNYASLLSLNSSAYIAREYQG